MFKKVTFLFFAIFYCQSIFAAGIKGKITDQSGKPLAYATIFIPENSSGTTTNEEGFYEITLTPGTYTVSFQFLGYETVIKEIVVTNGAKITENITLKDQTLDLKTIEVSDGRENPAYTIMRKAIAKAEFHRQQVERYTAMVYIKGSGRLLKSPLLLRKAIEKEGVDSTTAFVIESVNEVTYERPNTYKERVISIRQQGDDNQSSPNPYINGSFYEPEVVSAVSPLSPRAFGYYKFEFLGSYFERGHEINKIKVTPRSWGEGVYEGTISIVDDMWSIHSLNLKTIKLGITFEIQQIFAPIMEQVWLPVTHKFLVDVKIFGFKLVYNYLATVSDYQVELNPDLDVEFTVIDEKINKELAAEIESKPRPKKGSVEEKIASGEELTRKELRKMMKEYEKEDREKQEEPKMTENRSMSVDSLAHNKDTAFWAKIRPIPLTTYEVKSYRKADSLAVVQRLKKENSVNSGKSGSTKSSDKSGGFSIWEVLIGSQFKLGDKTNLVYGGLLQNSQLNAVEALAVKSELSVLHNLGEGKRLNYGLIPRWSFGREKLVGKGFLDYKFGEKFRTGNFRIEGGRYVTQINEADAISPFVNTIYYFFTENYAHLFEKDFVKGTFEKRVGDGLNINFAAEYAQRNSLENANAEGLFYKDKKDFSPNTPNNIEIGNTPFDTHKAVTLGAGFEWKPWIRYKVNNGERQYFNDAPIFSLNYKKGLADIDYDFAELGFKYSTKNIGGSRTDFKIIAGAFLNKDSLNLPDFKHFPGNQTILTVSDPVESFRLLPYYEYSTKDKFAQVHIHHQFRKLLLTQMPLFWMTGLKENAFLNYLATPSSENYVEVGYGLDNILKVFRIELITSFQDFKYHDFGFRISVSSMIGISTGENGNEVSIGL